MSESAAPRELRVSDAEREHVAGLLAGHMSAGRLGPDEYAERVDTATHAITRAELNAVLADLPGAHLPAPAAREVLELRNTMGDLRRGGQWVVPPTIRISSWCGNARIDTTQARFTGPVVALEVSIGGMVTDRTVETFERGDPHFVVRGGTKVGNITIKHG